MRKYCNYFFFLLTALLIIQCSPSSYFKTDHSSIAMDSTIGYNPQTDSLIRPYKEKLEKEMNEVLVISSEEFPKEKGKAQTKLGNLVADLCLEVASQLYKPTDGDSIDFCLLNFGGLRTSLPKGEITRGKIFELMPFENELVVVTISKSKLDDIKLYLYEIGGQPISGTTLVLRSYLKVDEMLNNFGPDGQLKILTSDYLANGGDNMSFFKYPVAYEPVGIKLRDAIIQYCVQENKKGNQLVGKIDGRITFE